MLRESCKLDNSTLRLVPCPTTSLAECYQSDHFLCAGPRRATRSTDIQAECFISEDGTVSSSAGRLSRASAALLALAAGAALLA